MREQPAAENRVDEDGLLHFLACERGKQLFDRTTRDAGELLFWAFESATFSFASAWVLRHPKDGEEQRVTRWARRGVPAPHPGPGVGAEVAASSSPPCRHHPPSIGADHPQRRVDPVRAALPRAFGARLAHPVQLRDVVEQR